MFYKTNFNDQYFNQRESITKFIPSFIINSYFRYTNFYEVQMVNSVVRKRKRPIQNLEITIDSYTDPRDLTIFCKSSFI